MRARLPLIASLVAVLFLTGCGPAAPGPTGTPTTPSTAASETPTAAPPPAPTPTPTASAAPITAGDCTAAENAAAYPPVARPTIYTVFTDDSTTPITLHYLTFNHDGSMPIATLTTTGPVITIFGYICTDAQSQANWILRMTTTHNVDATCVLTYGGQLIDTNVLAADELATKTCQGNPGR